MKQERARTGNASKLTVLGVICSLAILAVIINVRSYPDFVDSFSKRASVFFGLSNNELAELSIQKANECESEGLHSKMEYYLKWCDRFNPKDEKVIDKIAQHYYLNEDFHEALYWYKKALKQKPKNKYYKTAVLQCLYYTDSEAAIPLAEEIIIDDRDNEFAASVLRDHYFEKEEYEIALYWGIRSFCYKTDHQGDLDLEIFGHVLTKVLNSTNYQSDENTLIVSRSVYDQPILGLTNREYLEDGEKISNTAEFTLFLHNKDDYNYGDNTYYFVYLPDFQEGEIWRREKLIRNRKDLIVDYPSVVISVISILYNAPKTKGVVET